jgi:hypothetical protein
MVASDADLPANTLSFSLMPGAPAGASINPATGHFSWTPTEAQGPGTYTIGVKVTDDGTPSLSDSKTFTVTVSEVNAAPVLAAVPDQTVEEGSLLSLTVTASDADLPANTLTFSLMPGAPAGAAINPATGEFSWTPTEAQGPGTYTIGVKVSDDGTPNLSAERTFSVVVVAGNTVICSMPKEFEAGVSFRVTNRAAPSVQVHCYTVVDRVPKDWVASDISDGGSYDPRSRWVRWGPFYDNAIRDLTYLVMPPRDARGTYTFKGQAKFDDTTVPITGQRETTAIEVNRIVRSLPATLRAGGSAWVSNEVTVAASVSIYVVEDQVPAGWTASVISDKGTFDPARHTVKWGPFADCVPRTLIYLVTAPPGAAGPAAFSGTGVFDGLAVAITGDETLIVLPNHPPVARGDLLERRPHGALVVPVEKLLANDTDPDGDALTLSSVPPASVRGAKLVLAGPMLVYIPPQGFNGPDSFTYTVSDDSGAMATATVHVVVKPSNKGAQLAAVTGETSTIAPQPGGAVRLRFTGRPGLAYLVQATASLANPEWITLTAFAGDQDGAFESEDPQAPDYPTRFYRALALPAP